MSKQNPQSPAWGAPVSSAWGSPLSNPNRSGTNSPNQTPARPDRDNLPPHLNRSNSHPYRAPTPNHNNSPTGGNFQYNNSPRHFTPRPRYQSSPLNNSMGNNTPRFSRHNSSHAFTPSPRHHNQNNSRFVYHNSNRKSFSQNDRSMNPGGSDNINDYIHPSMLEDPWKDLKPKPLLRQY